MPITEIPKQTSSLTQGDILKDIRLFATGKGWEPSKGDAHLSPFDICMVISRPCAIEHKSSVVVAGIERLKLSMPREANTLEKVLSFFTNLRDGTSSPDVFYLGPIIDGDDAPYAARLDDLHTIQLPKELAAKQAFVEAKRIRRLNRDFQRDLHARIFRAVASLGFDDYGWLSETDLQTVVISGRKDVAAAEVSVHEEILEQKKRTLAGHRPSAEKSLKTAEANLRELQELLKPYEDELKRRSEGLASS